MIRFVTPADRNDLTAFVTRACRVDELAVIRLRRRADGAVGAWVMSGFDVLAGRVIRAELDNPDVVYDGPAMVAALRADPSASAVDAGFSIDSAWQAGALPPETGFGHVDDVPARTIVELSREGAHLARTQAGPLGPPASLLEQTVIEVDDPRASGAAAVAVPMRAVFALTAMGFVRTVDGAQVTETSPIEAIAADEPVRIRATGVWARLDARYGSVHVRRTAALAVTPT
ncbi:hypothetical protein [Williamsia sp.]|uniref:hypothetical protein n=1 Tax=Williamsia sp. TaxID=1872085 RepID=UPI001A26AAAE|nr:hypothetical protein [Williamsia sp.]MBJ7290502.1 hypothetical protein [Williamsia sp.]